MHRILASYLSILVGICFDCIVTSTALGYETLKRGAPEKGMKRDLERMQPPEKGFGIP
jgi:hypothetical protein